VVSTSTSKGLRAGRSAGFSAIELILGLALTLCLALAVAPLWLSLQSAGAQEGDQTVQMLQGRVAAARFEHDMRLASAAGCPFSLSAPILEASPSQTVFLTRTAVDAAPVLVEWEIVNGTLMRRRGVCPATRPTAFAHSLFVDHKTMLQEVKLGSSFVYLADGEVVDPSAGAVTFASVDSVVLQLSTAAAGASAAVSVAARGRVGR
jgi:hypothetical protein